MKATLMLEDGRSFCGELMGGKDEAAGEVVFNTAVVGYQELITDPANAGNILVLTYPLIGNYGVARKFSESARCRVSAVVVKEISRIYSNWQARKSLQDFCKESGLPLMQGVDTRALAVHLRSKGAMQGIISAETPTSKELLARLKSLHNCRHCGLLKKASVNRPTLIGKGAGKRRLAVLDLGTTNSLLGQLQGMGFSLQVFPYNTNAQDILRSRPSALVISGGPEDDPELQGVVSNAKTLLGRLPILGVCCGHQVLAAALGAKIIKMKLGHRGLNYPVSRAGSYKSEITAQNHGWVVDANSLAKVKGVRITAYNLNDRTVEEIEDKKLRIIGVQYYPSSPGCGEINPVFKRFLKMIKEH